jgi:hypothetical protein
MADQPFRLWINPESPLCTLIGAGSGHVFASRGSKKKLSTLVAELKGGVSPLHAFKKHGVLVPLSHVTEARITEGRVVDDAFCGPLISVKCKGSALFLPIGLALVLGPFWGMLFYAAYDLGEYKKAEAGWRREPMHRLAGRDAGLLADCRARRRVPGMAHPVGNSACIEARAIRGN